MLGLARREFEDLCIEQLIYEQGGVLSATSARSTSALFGLVSRNSQRAISPVNECALSRDLRFPRFTAFTQFQESRARTFWIWRNGSDRRFDFTESKRRQSSWRDVEFGNSLDSLAEYYTNALVEFQPAGPIVLGGWCVGAVIALAMAQKLRARGREVGPLVAIDGAPENIKVAAMALGANVHYGVDSQSVWMVSSFRGDAHAVPAELSMEHC